MPSGKPSQLPQKQPKYRGTELLFTLLLTSKSIKPHKDGGWNEIHGIDFYFNVIRSSTPSMRWLCGLQLLIRQCHQIFNFSYITMSWSLVPSKCEVLGSSTSTITRLSGLQLLQQQGHWVFNTSYNEVVRSFNFSNNYFIGSSTLPITKSSGLQLLQQGGWVLNTC